MKKIVLFGSLLGVLFGLIVECGFDLIKYNLRLDDSKTSEIDLRHYSNSPFFTHVIFKNVWLTTDDAGRKADEIHIIREKNSWEKVKKVNGNARYERLKAHDKEFPSGLYKDEAIRLAEPFEKNMPNVRADIEDALVNQNEEIVLSRLAKAKESLKLRDGVLSEDAEQSFTEEKLLLGNLEGRIEMFNQQRKFYQLMRDGNPVKAGRLLKTPENKFSSEVFEYYQNNWEASVRRSIRNLGPDRWKESLRMLIEFEKRVMVTVPEIVSYKESKRILNELKKELEIVGDKLAYRSVVDSGSLEECELYLNNAPIRSMVKEVEKYKVYLSSLDNEFSPTVKVDAILWSSHVDDSPKNTLKISYQTEKYISPQFFEEKGLVSKKGSKVKPTQLFKLQAMKLDDIIALTVEIEETKLRNCSHGKFSQKLRLRDLDTFEAELIDAKRGGSKVIFSAEGLPQKPLMSAWHNKK